VKYFKPIPEPYMKNVHWSKGKNGKGCPSSALEGTSSLLGALPSADGVCATSMTSYLAFDPPEGIDRHPPRCFPAYSREVRGRTCSRRSTRIGPFPMGMILKSCWIHSGFPTAFPTRAIIPIVLPSIYNFAYLMRYPEYYLFYINKNE
jgi:hypothetical protein